MPKSTAFTVYSLDGLHSATYQQDAKARYFQPDTEASASFAQWLNGILQTSVITDPAAFCATYGVSLEPQPVAAPTDVPDVTGAPTPAPDAANTDDTATAP